MVSVPGEYRWSGYACNADGAANRFICPHSDYRALGHTAAERQGTCKVLFALHVELGMTDKIRHCANHGLPLGDSGFKKEIEEMLGRRTQDRDPGRPEGGT